MTRTERASYPRALRKDRSEPKNAMNKRIPKQGAGPHNWGAIDDQLELESAAEADEEVELEREGVKPGEASEEVPRPSSVGSRRASSGSLTDEEREKARLTRLHAMARDDIDLNTIARTSSVVSTSPPTSIPVVSGNSTGALKLD
ncbi:unnamed protein product [Somion occarium]|uniref:Hyaluronan/mRNA-binding protein domain-containing protein n=1 Tax=Somion occarium TaxID=3059160 RepID=A0ABP1DU89_9APHY